MTKQPDQLGRWVERPPLRSVQLENFKSVFSADVDLGMLTVLVGKNSAGKSTLLDAILMRSQADIGYLDPGIPLNGHLLNLGTFDDVLNVNWKEDPLVRVGAAISVNFDDEPRPGRRGPRRPSWRNRGDQDSTSRSARQTRFFSLAEEAFRTIARTINEKGFLRRPKPYDLTISWSIGFGSRDEVACCDLSLDSESAGSLASAAVNSVDTDGRQRPALLQHLPSVGQSIEFQQEHPPTFGEATHYAEEQAKAICEAVLVDGLPEAVRTASGAKQLVVRALVDYWVELLEGALIEDPEAPLALTRQQNLRLPLEQEPVHPVPGPEFHERPTGWGEDEELTELVDDLANQAALWVSFYLNHVGDDRLRDELRRVPRNRWRSSSSEYHPQDFFEGFEIRPMLSLSDARRKKAEITGRLDAGGGPEGAERLSEAIRGTGREEELRLPSDLVASLGRFYTQVGVGQFYDRVEAAMGRDGLVEAAIIMDQDFNHALSSLRRAVQEFMVNHVSHIGPLRLGPQPLYTQGRDDRLPTVGQKGENTAAVLANQGGANVVCPKKGGGSEEMPLSEAIAYWLGKDGLELVDGIRSTPWGAAGYELKVKPVGIDKWVHLMAVGTGVSQVLPVLVQGLLCDPGSVLVLQEPGSQLHPALQQDLGDFLLACAQSGKQVLLETHSEYLVTRLARRIAEGADADLVKLLRVDYSEEAGTTYQPAPIDEYGTIEWPEGFFEEASDEAFKILDAGLAKQATQED